MRNLLFAMHIFVLASVAYAEGPKLLSRQFSSGIGPLAVRGNEVWGVWNNYGVARWNIETGEGEYMADDSWMASSIVNDLEFDSKGNLWIAGQHGLIRFDGQNLFHFDTENGLGGDWAGCILADSRDRLWCGYWNLFRRQPVLAGMFDGDNWRNFSDREGLVLPDGRIPSVRVIKEDENGVIWLKTGREVFRYTGTEWVLVTEPIRGLRGKDWINTPVADTAAAPVFDPWPADSKGRAWTIKNRVGYYDGSQYIEIEAPASARNMTSFVNKPLAINENDIVFFTIGNILYSYDPATEAVREFPTPVPNRLFIRRSQQPNPFSPYNAVDFFLADSNEVKLEILDLDKQLVRVLLDTVMAAGCYHMFWDCKDDLGNPVKSGEFISKLSQGNKTVTRKKMWFSFPPQK